MGFVETNKTTEMYQNRRVYGIDEIPKEYDFIVVANSYTKDIYNTCQIRCIPLEKVIFLK